MGWLRSGGESRQTATARGSAVAAGNRWTEGVDPDTDQRAYLGTERRNGNRWAEALDPETDQRAYLETERLGACLGTERLGNRWAEGVDQGAGPIVEREAAPHFFKLRFTRGSRSCLGQSWRARRAALFATSLSPFVFPVRRVHSKRRLELGRAYRAQPVTLPMIPVRPNACLAFLARLHIQGVLPAPATSIYSVKHVTDIARRTRAKKDGARQTAPASVTTAMQGAIVPLPFAAVNSVSQASAMGALCLTHMMGPFARAIFQLQSTGVLRDSLEKIALKPDRIGRTSRVEFSEILSNAFRALGVATAAIAQRATMGIIVERRAILA